MNMKYSFNFSYFLFLGIFVFWTNLGWSEADLEEKKFKTLQNEKFPSLVPEKDMDFPSTLNPSSQGISNFSIKDSSQKHLLLQLFFIGFSSTSKNKIL